MSNITEHKLTSVISAADITAITNAFTLGYSKLPPINLNDDQRAKLKSINVNNKVFIEDAIVEMGLPGSAGIVPAYISQSMMQVNLTVFMQIDALESQVNSILRRLSDCKRVAGDDAYSAALAVYTAFESAHKGGVMNAKDSYVKLGARFETQGNGGRVTTDQP